jgi:hypothetical protein
MERIDAGDRSVRLSLDEIQLWSEEAEKWASETGIVLPERGEGLKFKLYWEGPAQAYILRVLNRLKAASPNQMQEYDAQVSGRPH